MRGLFALGVVVFLASCASLSEEACRSGDWEGIGYRDGVNGQYTSYLNNHVEACADYGITPNRALWLLGRTEGLKQYCTKENTYEIGTHGREMNAVCEGYNVDSLRLANFFGLRYHEITEEMNAIERDIRALHSEIAILLEGEPTPEEIALANAKRLEIIHLERELRALRFERLKYARIP
ncbi:MAG TPA: DUF2799 domain-containing protein [Paracoccaceae bacterium]|nr:DUF2799 domain-containing protein [Paracoccaceae bacterium]